MGILIVNMDKTSKTGKKNIEQIIKNLIVETITNLGLQLWDVLYYNDSGEWYLEVVIDITDTNNTDNTDNKYDKTEKSGISLNDCELVTRTITPIIDEADPIETSYCLMVASPGLNRELKNDVHISKYAGKPVSVKLFAKNENLILLNTDGKSFIGVLKEYSNESMTFEISEKSKPGKKSDKPKSKKNNIINIIDIDITDTADTDGLNKIITIARKDIAHIYACDEVWI